MSEFKGTKGKWTRYLSSLMGSDKIVSHSVYVGTKRIALCYNLFETDKSKNVEEKEAEANAKLIACAPEMLDMLIELNNFCNMKIEDHNKLEQLIKKATE